MHTREELEAMKLVDLTPLHNRFSGKTVKKLKIPKVVAINEILEGEAREARVAAAEPQSLEEKPTIIGTLRNLFPSVGEKKDRDEVFAHVEATTGAKPSTIATSICDVRVPERAGKKGVLNLQRDGKWLVRVA
jgi:hypothetical protein